MLNYYNNTLRLEAKGINMSEQDNVNDNTSNVTVDDTNISDIDNNESSDDSFADETSEERIARLEQQNKKLFARAKEAEGYKLVDGKWVKKEKPQHPSPSKPDDTQSKNDFDLEDVAILVTKVSNKEDREFVKKSAKILGVSLENALDDPFVIGKLKESAEQRQTANATSTGTSRRTSPKMTDEQIVQNFREGKQVDPEALAIARINLKKQKK